MSPSAPARSLRFDPYGLQEFARLYFHAVEYVYGTGAVNDVRGHGRGRRGLRYHTPFPYPNRQMLPSALAGANVAEMAARGRDGGRQSRGPRCPRYLRAAPNQIEQPVVTPALNLPEMAAPQIVTSNHVVQNEAGKTPSATAGENNTPGSPTVSSTTASTKPDENGRP